MYDTVSISVLHSIKPDSSGKKAWSVRVEINDNAPFDVDALYDPFHEDDYEHFRWYLEDSWREKPSQEADELKRKEEEEEAKEKQEHSLAEIHRYGKELFEQLRLGEHSFAGRTREIFIHNSCASDGDKIDESVNRVVWEQLGDPLLWPNRPECVSITRVSKPSPHSGPEKDHFDKTFIVLLVVARSFKQDRDLEYFANFDAGASLVQVPLMQIIAQLRAIRKGYRMELEIIRPGSWEELQEHLLESPRGHFDLIHFDLHGEIEGTAQSKAIQSYFLFARPSEAPHHIFSRRKMQKEEVGLEKVPATKIAEVLHASGITRVVISACRSAYTLVGSRGNTSHVFIQHGLGPVAAMSFKVTSPAVSIFCEGFYTALILDCKGFDEAVGYGRSALHKKQDRGKISLSDAILAQTYSQYAQSQRHRLNTDLSPGFIHILRTAYNYVLQCFDTPYFNRLFQRWAHFTSPLPDLVNSYTPIYPALQSLGIDIGKIQYHSIVKMDIRMMHLEDRLKQTGSLYIWGPPTARNTEFIRTMADMWILTNFVDSIHSVNVSRFLESGFRIHLRKILALLWGQDGSLLRRKPPVSRRKQYRKGSRRQLYIIEDVNQLSAPDLKSSTREVAERRLRAFYKTINLDRSFLIIIGRDADWMEKQEWGDGIEAFNHNRPFPTSSKYNN